MKKIISLLLLVVLVLSGCSRESDIASKNVSYASDEFKVMRRVVFINNVTGDYMLEIVGNCSVETSESMTTNHYDTLELTCKTGSDQYQKHYLGLNDTTTYIVEQLEWVEADAYHYEIAFRPEEIIPDVNLETSNNKNSSESQEEIEQIEEELENEDIDLETEEVDSDDVSLTDNELNAVLAVIGSDEDGNSFSSSSSDDEEDEQ